MIGITLTTAVVFALIVIFLELRIVFGVPLLKKIVQKGAVFGIAISIVLTLILGTLFGAGGIIVMMAVMFATLVTQPVYSVSARRERQRQKKLEVRK